jgi:hypothetical protein
MSDKSWFQIIEATVRGGRIYVKGHWMVGPEENPTPRNNNLRPIELEPVLVTEILEQKAIDMLSELATKKKGQPIEPEEKQAIYAGLEDDFPLYKALAVFMKCLADNLHEETGVQCSVSF